MPDTLVSNFSVPIWYLFFFHKHPDACEYLDFRDLQVVSMQKIACVLRSAPIVAKESRNVYANPLVRRNVSALYVSPSFNNNAAFGILGLFC